MEKNDQTDHVCVVSVLVVTVRLVDVVVVVVEDANKKASTAAVF